MSAVTYPQQGVRLPRFCTNCGEWFDGWDTGIHCRTWVEPPPIPDYSAPGYRYGPLGEYRQFPAASSQGALGEYDEMLPLDEGFYCYRMWSSDGRCLYVGMVGENGPRRLQLRLAEHRRTKSWWPDVARVDAARCGDWRSADEEALQILQLKPVHNVRIPKVVAVA